MCERCLVCLRGKRKNVDIPNAMHDKQAAALKLTDSFNHKLRWGRQERQIEGEKETTGKRERTREHVY